jgi:hypothetical protein
MYRQGLGDCFLVSFPTAAGGLYHVVIDCGVLLGTADAPKKINDVVADIRATTGDHINLLAATHEHWDHVSGFSQAEALWTDPALRIDEVWMAWTENERDPQARRLRGERHDMRVALTVSAARLRAAGDEGVAGEVMGLLEFFGAAGSRGTAAAFDVVRRLTPAPKYCEPTADPTLLPGTDARVYVLGPPRDEKLLKKYSPSKTHPETYEFAAAERLLGAVAGRFAVPEDAPFDPAAQIPMAVAEQLPFFQDRYWGEDEDWRDGDPQSAAKDQSWRRIDASWLAPTSTLALHLDSATNNTSMVLAFELAGGDVLLFASDAQVGNWLSWQTLEWEVDGAKIKGPDLLKRAVFYKVGHHGSHNATLREQGLEQMTSLDVAFLPVDRAMAVKKNWNRMPLAGLVTRLDEVTAGKVVRIDEPAPAPLAGRVATTDLYHEIEL